MADVTRISSEIADAASRSGLTLRAGEPGAFRAQFHHARARALVQAGHASVHARQQQFAVAQAATVRGIAALFAAAADDPALIARSADLPAALHNQP